MDETHYEVDDRFVGDWFAFGLRELEAYLASHARFDRFCAPDDDQPASPAA